MKKKVKNVYATNSIQKITRPTAKEQGEPRASVIKGNGDLRTKQR